MPILDFIALVFASQQVIDTWYNASNLAGARAFIQAKSDAPPIVEDSDDLPEEEQPSRWSRLVDRLTPVWVAHLLECWYCFSHHTPWLLAVVFLATSYAVPWCWLGFVMRIPVYSLAATRIGILINFHLHSDNRYRRDD